MLKRIKEQLKQTPVKGFLADDEAEKLYQLASEASSLGPCLEIGSYCGLSTIYLAKACQKNNQVLFALDHHRGSEEHQVGEQYHDPELYDSSLNAFDTFNEFRRTLINFDLVSNVIPLVADTSLVCRYWTTPLSMIFIDGGHGVETTQHDFLNWPPHLICGGILAVHDIFSDPKDGGQAPYDALQKLLANQKFEKLERVNSMEVYRKID